MSDNYVKTDEFLSFVNDNENRTWVFLDTETLGFNGDKHQLTEVAAKAISIQGKTYRELATYHEKSRLLSITRLRLSMPYNGPGLSYRDLMKMTNYGESLKSRQYIDEVEVIRGLLLFLNDYENPIIVAHNAPFDINFLNKRGNVYFEEKNIFNKYEVVDTLRVMKKYFAPLVITEAERFNHRWLPPSERQYILKMRSVYKFLKKKKSNRISLKLGNVAGAFGLAADGWHTAIYDIQMLISTTEEILKLFNNSRGKKLYPEKYFK